MPTLKTVMNGTRKFSVNITGGHTLTDSAADLTNAVVIDRSALIGPDRQNPPTRIRIDTITWSIGVGYDYIVLDFDDATDEVIEILQGQGFFDYRTFGGKSMAGAPTTATEGDVQMTTAGGGAADSYSIFLECTLCQ